ncbi:MAG TPA: hypothetical protein EYG31_02100 [Porticoccaceae bacterium]|jgi:peptidoglycan/LPS O-acetylase OafA/YrhL|nr:hypothetical protein [Gammaproteobacteria bacterium]HIL59412.1 hypothetical protein [Porticoccaceae bacterium]
MIALIGLAVIWVIGVVIAMMIVNSIRASNGANIQDGLTAFSQGFAFGPISVVAAFGPMTRTNNRGAMAVGGIVGTIAFIYTYMQL